MHDKIKSIKVNIMVLQLTRLTMPQGHQGSTHHLKFISCLSTAVTSHRNCQPIIQLIPIHQVLQHLSDPTANHMPHLHPFLT